MLHHVPIVENGPATHLHWPSEADTAAFARQLAKRPEINNLYIELRGSLGAGKTSFVRHLLRALGVTGRIKSPTFAVVEPHETPAGTVISHFDFYRFSDPQEFEDAGFRELFAAPGLKLVEWPEHAGQALPKPDLMLQLEIVSQEARTVKLQAGTTLGAHILQELCP